jgi:hypothetical protein
VTATSYALILDDEEASLGRVALRMLRAGIQVLHAKGLHEAWLLGEQERDRVRALLFPTSVRLEDVVTLSQRLERDGKEGSLRLVAIGPEPEPAARDRLREAGVDWGVWNPDDDSALRFVVNTALSLPREIVPRQEPCAVTALDAQLQVGTERKGVEVHVLSARGAFLATPRPPGENSTVTLQIQLPKGAIRAQGRVVYCNTAAERRSPDLPVGAGVVFTELDAEAEKRVRAFVHSQARFAI